MTAIIPLLNSHNPADHEELRYALRSLTQQGVTRCILVGGRPKWYTGDHIPHADYSPKFKEQNIRDKVLLGASYIDGEFMFANDDHYLLSPLQAIYDNGTLSEAITLRNPQSSYFKTLRNTRDYFGDVRNTDCHCPMFMDAALVQKTAFDWPEHGYAFKTTYCQVNNLSSVYMEDCKIDTPPEPGRLYFSTRMFKGWLKNIFPNPCIFER